MMSRMMLHPLHPKYSTAESAMVDRRKSIRTTHQAAFSIRPILNDGIGKPVLVVLQDLSNTGMGIIHSHPMGCGEHYQIPLEAGSNLSLVCTVVRCEKMDEDLYSIGFEFNSCAAAIEAGSRQLRGQTRPGPSVT